MNSTSIVFICLTIIIVFAISRCSTEIDPKDTAAIAEACAKIGKEPLIATRSGDGILMSCVGQPASSPTR